MRKKVGANPRSQRTHVVCTRDGNDAREVGRLIITTKTLVVTQRGEARGTLTFQENGSYKKVTPQVKEHSVREVQSPRTCSRSGTRGLTAPIRRLWTFAWRKSARVARLAPMMMYTKFGTWTTLKS